jgi:hypothetical protein
MAHPEKVIVPLANVNPTRERQEATKPSPERMQELMAVAVKEKMEVSVSDENGGHALMVILQAQLQQEGKEVNEKDSKAFILSSLDFDLFSSSEVYVNPVTGEIGGPKGPEPTRSLNNLFSFTH